MKWLSMRMGRNEATAVAEAPPVPFSPGTPVAEIPAVVPVPEEASAPATAPGTEIRYDANLIAHFVDDHQELAVLVSQVKAAAAEEKYAEATRLLGQLKTKIFQHFLEENVRFYTYLAYCLKNDPEGSEVMGDMRREMGEIGRTVTRFLKAYETGIDSGNAGRFLHQFDDVVATLTDRIQREESSLYTLYQPPSKFVVQS